MVDWEADYRHEQTTQNLYGDFSMQEALALAYLNATRRQVTVAGLTNLTSFDGRHRSGKSIAALTLAYLWDPTFWTFFEQRLIREPSDFMDALENIEKEKIKNPVIQVDEAGVSMSSSEWYERWMKTLSKTVQMFGYLHPTVFFVAPIKDFVDSRLRKMFHSYYAVSRFTTDYSVILPYNMHYSTIKNKWYYKKPTVKYAGQNIRLDKLKIGLPPLFIVERYQEYEKGTKAKMLEDFISEMRKDEASDVKEEKDLNKIIQYVADNYELYQTKFSKPDNITLDKTIIQYSFKLSTNESQYVKIQAERTLKAKATQVTQEIGVDTPAKPRHIGSPFAGGTGVFG